MGPAARHDGVAGRGGLGAGVNRDRLVASIRLHEGYRENPYLCPTGHWSVGWGHNVHFAELRSFAPHRTVGKLLDALSDPQNHERWLAQDVNRAIWDAERYVGTETWNRLSDARQEVLSEAAFQLGYTGLCGFVRLRAAIIACEWVRAEAEMLDSRVAKEQAPERWRKLASRMLEG